MNATVAMLLCGMIGCILLAIAQSLWWLIGVAWFAFLAVLNLTRAKSK